MSKFLARFALLSSVVFTGAAAHASSITYNVNISYSNVSATGTITTEGNLGNLNISDITAYNLVVTEGSNSIDVTTATGRVAGSGGFSATSSGLFFDFSSADYLLFQDSGGNKGYVCFQGPNGHCDYNGFGNTVGNISIQTPLNTLTGVAEDMSGVQQIASTLAPTPEPGSIVLLGTGALGCFGVLRRRMAGR